MKSKLEKRIERTTIGFMTIGTLVSIILFVKDCNYNHSKKELSIKKEIKNTYNPEDKGSNPYIIY